MNSTQRLVVTAGCIVIATFIHLWFVNWGWAFSDTLDPAPNVICFFRVHDDDANSMFAGVTKIQGDGFVLVSVEKCFGLTLHEDTNPTIAFFIGIVTPIAVLAIGIWLQLRGHTTARG